MSPTLNGGGRERVTPVTDLRFKNLHLRAKISYFVCTKPPKNPMKTAKCLEIVATLHMQLDFPVPKGPLGPSNSTVCLRIAP